MDLDPNRFAALLRRYDQGPLGVLLSPPIVLAAIVIPGGVTLLITVLLLFVAPDANADQTEAVTAHVEAEEGPRAEA